MKNGIPASVKLLPEALELIAKYHDDNRDTLFPYIKNKVLSRHIRGIGLRLGIKGLRYHMGRHSFSTLITLEEGVPVETISRMLGHKNIAVTQIYGKILKSNVEKNVNKRLKKLK